MKWDSLERKAAEALKRNAALINETKRGTAGQKPATRKKPTRGKHGGRAT